MPKVEHAMRTRRKKSRTINHISLPLGQRFQQRSIFRRIIFEIGVLNDHKVSRGFPDAAVQGCAFPYVTGLKESSDLGMLSLQFCQNLTRSISRSIVHAN